MAGIRCSLLIGRERETSGLIELVSATTAGHGGSGFVVGEAGIGKSRLLDTAADSARSRGMAVLRGRAAPSPVPTPYRPFAEAFASALRGHDLDVQGSLAQFQSAIATLVPGRFDVDPGASPSIVLLGEATIALIERCAAGRGALVLLEDMHWAGGETWELVDYLSDKLDSLAIAMIVSVRTGEGPEAERMVRTVESRRHGRIQWLDRLDGADIDAMIGSSLGMRAVPSTLREFVARASGGVPLLIEDVLATLVDRGALQRNGTEWTSAESLPGLVPASFSALVRDRSNALDGAAMTVLQAAAVLGERFRWTLLPAVTGFERDAVVACLRRGVEAQLIDDVPGGDTDRFRFRHGLSRAAVLESVGDDERAKIAARALAILDSDEHPASGGRLELLADLALTAGDDDRATGLFVEASRQASQQGACTSAQRFADLALGLARTDESRLAAQEVLLAACVTAGDSARTAKVGADLMTLLERLGISGDRRAAVRLQLAAASIEATDWRAAADHVDAAMKLAEPAMPGVDGQVDVLRACIALGQHDPAGAAEHAQLAFEIGAARDDPSLTVEALSLLGRVRRLSDLPGAEDAFGRAVAVATRARSDLLLARAVAELGTIDVIVAGSPETLERARRLAVEAGAVAVAATADFHLTIVYWLHFELDRSREAVERAIAAATRYELGLKTPATLVMLGAIDAVMGRRAEATAAFERAAAQMDPEIEATNRGHVLAFAALACEDRASVLTELAHAASLAPAYSDVARAPFSGMRALLMAIESNPTAAPVVAALLDDPGVVGVTRRIVSLASAVLAGRRGDRDTANRTSERAFEELTATPWFCAMTQRLVSEAALTDGWGTPRRWLLSADAFFEHAGINAPAQACRALLEQTQPEPVQNDARPSGAAINGVSRRETDVLELVAQGMSNRDIAQRLYLSVRTVEKHVEHLLAKTGSANRAQLVGLAIRADGNTTTR